MDDDKWKSLVLFYYRGIMDSSASARRMTRVFEDNLALLGPLDLKYKCTSFSNSASRVCKKLSQPSFDGRVDGDSETKPCLPTAALLTVK